jgi:hypothetical protein
MKRFTGNPEAVKFWILLLILLLSIGLAWYLNSSLSQTLSNQFK